MVKHWGHIDDADDVRLDKEARAFAAKLKNTKSVRAAETCVRNFLRAYLKIGDDPTDTVVRDNVWSFLLSKTKGKFTHSELDAIWKEEVRKSTACVIS